MRRVTSSILLPLLALVWQGNAQNITGSMSGRVVDASGGGIPEAVVTANEPAKQVNARTVTTRDGEFSLAGLLPGNYNLTVEARGFKKLSRANIPLDAQDKLALGNIPLEIGAVTESIQVEASAVLLQTESVERSEAIVGKQIQNIEVNGRNPLDMAKLVPGIVSTANVSVGGVGGLSSVYVNGNRGTMNQLTINGIGDIDTGADGSQNVTVSIDSIAEFKVLTGQYQAEYGRNAGGQIAMVTKSGAEQFHGSGYIYHRHDDLNANTFINNVRGLPRTLYRYNDPGYTIGGPVYIPRVETRTKNKLFFFWSQEWQKQLAPQSLKNIEVPTALERQGNFSQSVDNNNKPLLLRDPTTQTPLAGNIIPQSQIYAPGQALANLLPLPNTSGTGYNYTSQFSVQQPRREDLLRGDYNVTEEVRVFGHFIHNVQPVVTPYGSFVLGENMPLTNINDPTPGISFAGGATWLISPTMTNELNIGMTKNQIDIFEVGNVLTRTASKVALPLLYPNAVQDDYIPQINVTGSHLNSANNPSFGTADAPFHNFNTTIDYSDNLTKVSGKHTIKAGIYLQRSRKDQTSFSDNNGSYNWGDTTSNPLDTGYGYSNMLYGVYQTMDQSSAYINGLYRYWNIEGFVQDTWKIAPRVTFDYGLRISWYQPQYDSSKQASTFVLADWQASQAPRLYAPAFNPATGLRSAYDRVTNTYLPSYDIGLEVPNSGNPFNGICQAGTCIGKYLQNDPGAQWGPRFGVAWDVFGNSSMVIRTGGGVFYDRFQGNRVFDFVRNPPETVQPTLFYGFAQNINPATALLAPPTLYAADPTGKVPTTYNFQFSIQKRLPWEMVLDTAYVGTLGRHLQDNRNLNPVPYGANFLAQNQDPTLLATQPTALQGNNSLPANFLRPMIGYNSVTVYESAATSNYNALQFALNRRASRGLFLGVTYTLSKVLTTASSDTSSVRVDQYTHAADYGAASFDTRQNFALNYVYSIPGVKQNVFLRGLTGGWQLSGVTSIRTGMPFTPGFSVSGAGSSNQTGSNTETARIGYVLGCNPYTGSSNPFNRLNAACFTAPMPGSVGLESGLDWLYNPGLVNFDLALQRDVSLKERYHFQFRVDAFNVFNHANFTGLNTTLNFNAYPTSNGVVTGLPTVANNATPYNAGGQLVNVTGFGAVTSPAAGAPGGPRVLQLLVRFTF
jgi:Carboxypeptidase regulatory-like domain/TonB-dependent Receptor Plug Domain